MLEILAGIISIVAGVAGNAFYTFIKETFQKEETSEIPYSEKMATLTQSLTNASADVDRILKEMSGVAHQREVAISELEEQLTLMTERERQLQEKISTLEKVPLPAVEYFVSEIEKGEKRSARRDIVLFGLGVVVSTIVAIILKVFFGI